jgi:hypothetical protein
LVTGKREDFNVTRVKALTVPHQRLLDIVKRLGGVPTKHGTKRTFWDRVQEAWNQAVEPQDSVGGRVLERRYTRLIKKLGVPEL